MSGGTRLRFLLSGVGRKSIQGEKKERGRQHGRVAAEGFFGSFVSLSPSEGAWGSERFTLVHVRKISLVDQEIGNVD